MRESLSHDPLYDTVDRDDFESMICVARYGTRSSDFDAILAATEEHFWDPTDPEYIDFSQPFDFSAQTLLPREMILELNSAVADRLDEGQQLQLASQVSRFFLSSILHGEQGALSLSTNLCQVLRDPGAQEYAANQAREEARHVAAFTRYVHERWGAPLRAGPTLSNLMAGIVRAPEVYKKLIGMQLLIEGLAMGAFATLHARAADPVLRRLVLLVMADEAFHHEFGRVWAERTIPRLDEREHEQVETWAAECFQALLYNLINAEQKREIYAAFGMDWQWVRDAIQEVFGDAERRENLAQSTNLFRVLIKTLLQGGIITERTRPLYAAWVDLDALAAEGDRGAGQDVANESLAVLRGVNRSRRRRWRRTAPRA
jgi:hypothetical protein